MWLLKRYFFKLVSAFLSTNFGIPRLFPCKPSGGNSTLINGNFKIGGRTNSCILHTKKKSSFLTRTLPHSSFQLSFFRLCIVWYCDNTIPHVECLRYHNPQDFLVMGLLHSQQNILCSHLLNENKKIN